MKQQLVVFSALVLLSCCAACSRSPDFFNVGANANNVSTASWNDFPPVNTTETNEVSTPPVPIPPSHNYTFVDGNQYGYTAAISEEDQKKGKAAGDIVMFSYAGHWNNSYHIDEVNDAGYVLANYECGTPCIAIKIGQGAYARRIAYTPLSVIGMAFQDAMRGELSEKRAPKAYTPAIDRTPAPTPLQTGNASASTAPHAPQSESNLQN